MRGEIFDRLSDLVLMVNCAVCSHLGFNVESDCSLMAPCCIGSLLTAWNMRGVWIIAQVMGGEGANMPAWPFVLTFVFHIMSLMTCIAYFVY